jgi:CheY-like chemotaxis protein
MGALILALLEHPAQNAEVIACLQETDHELVVVNGFADAQAVLEELTFDLIVSDVHLENGGTVFDFLKWVKGRAELRPIPFVLLSLHPTARAKYLADGVQTTARILGAAKYIAMEKFDGLVFAKEIRELLPPARPVAPTLIEEGD